MLFPNIIKDTDLSTIQSSTDSEHARVEEIGGIEYIKVHVQDQTGDPLETTAEWTAIQDVLSQDGTSGILAQVDPEASKTFYVNAAGWAAYVAALS